MDSPGGGRYARQSILPEVGVAGQARLQAARVLIVGCGALGSGAAELLGRAGIGFLRLVDRDIVESTNIQRQLLFDEQDVAARTPKALAAATRLRQINSTITIEPHVLDAVALVSLAKSSGSPRLQRASLPFTRYAKASQDRPSSLPGSDSQPG